MTHRPKYCGPKGKELAEWGGDKTSKLCEGVKCEVTLAGRTIHCEYLNDISTVEPTVQPNVPELKLVHPHILGTLIQQPE